MDLDQLLTDISVHSPGQWENDQGPKDWWAISTEGAGGIVAYCADEALAYYIRLALINAKLNPIDKI